MFKKLTRVALVSVASILDQWRVSVSMTLKTKLWGNLRIWSSKNCNIVHQTMTVYFRHFGSKFLGRGGGEGRGKRRAG